MDGKNIKKWFIEKKIEEKSFAEFWKFFNNWIEESPDEFEAAFEGNYCAEKLLVYICTVSFSITNWNAEDCDQYKHIVVMVRFELDESEIGYYRLVFDLDGEFIDDQFDVYIDYSSL